MGVGHSHTLGGGLGVGHAHKLGGGVGMGVGHMLGRKVGIGLERMIINGINTAMRMTSRMRIRQITPQHTPQPMHHLPPLDLLKSG